MEEEKLIPNKTPVTEEQLKQFYNSEQWKDVAEALSRICKTIKEAITPVIAAATKAARELHRWLMIAFSTDPEIKKCYRIYKRTKNRRIKKKQLTRISKIIKRRYIENDNSESR